MTGAIYIYHRGTRLARIARELRIPVQYPTENGLWVSTRKNRTSRLRSGVNWGNLRSIPVPLGTKVLNEPKNVLNASRKVRAFKLFNSNDIPCPEWSKSFTKLNERISEKRTILARKDGLSGGKGIHIIPPDQRNRYNAEGNGSDFYVARISYQREFRVHVWLGEIIVEQVKLLADGTDSMIHSHENGALFSAERLDRFLSSTQHKQLRALALKSINVLNLDFGAVDFIMDPKSNIYVLEVNTAPGIRSDPVETAYRSILKEFII